MRSCSRLVGEQGEAETADRAVGRLGPPRPTPLSSRDIASEGPASEPDIFRECCPDNKVAFCVAPDESVRRLETLHTCKVQIGFTLSHLSTPWECTRSAPAPSCPDVSGQL